MESSIIRPFDLSPDEKHFEKADFIQNEECDSMLAEIRSQLNESQDKWKTKSENHSPSRKDGLGSIQKRLAELNSSSEDWRRKVRKDVLSSTTASSNRRKSLVDKEKEVSNVVPSKANTLHNIDSGLAIFFSSTPIPKTKALTKDEPEQEIDIDLDAIQPSQRLSTPRRLVPRPGRPARRKVATDRLKAIDVESVHCEEDLRDHLIIEEIDDDKSVPVSTSARRGLQSIENYDAAKSALKQADLTSPFPDVMLIRIMGEKKVDVRIVEPKATSVHQHGCFVLVTPKRLFLYTGSESNILERTKGAQITTAIIQKKDLFCGAECLERAEGTATAFFRALGGGSPNDAFDRPAEPFENLAATANLILRVTDDYKIQSICKGERPRFSILQSNETLILDFGSEIYIWSGRNAKKTSARYAKEYVNKLIKCGLGCNEMIFGCDLSEKRADWIIVRRVFQGVQDVLFASKFSDWQTSELKHLFRTPMKTKWKESTPLRDPEQDAIELAEKLKNLEHQLPSLVLEDMEFGRQAKDVITESHTFWVLRGEQLEPIENTNILWSDECYVLKWQYRIQLSGVRRLKDGSEVERETGRQRIAHFYWLGRKTTPKLQGLCALKLSHMDKAKSPHIRQVQGSEHPVFLELFGGKLVIRDREMSENLFVIRGSLSSEANLEQISREQPFRSHAVYLEAKADHPVVLHVGACCSEVHVSSGLLMAKLLADQGLASDGEPIPRVQGDDPAFEWLLAKKRTKAPRMFRLFDLEGEEVQSNAYHPSAVAPFPHFQSELRDTVLVDAGGMLWIWSEGAPSTHCLETASRYWSKRDGSCTVVEKGNEPPEFIALFQEWNEWPAPTDEESPMTPETTPPRALDVCLSERRRTFTPAELRSRESLPPGLDLSRLHRYLNEQDFEKEFGMSPKDFSSLPQWKQVRMRKDLGFF